VVAVLDTGTDDHPDLEENLSDGPLDCGRHASFASGGNGACTQSTSGALNVGIIPADLTEATIRGDRCQERGRAGARIDGRYSPELGIRCSAALILSAGF
jgi:hypothetical protein